MSSPSLTLRAALALAFMIGFYVLALAIAGLLILIPIAELQFARRLHIQLAIACFAAAGAILWSILPRRDRFVPPGPLLRPEEHPRLFEVLAGVARATGQAMPSEVYLAPEFNAWVAQRGGVMGIGGRRVMGLGLSLMQVLPVSQLRAVLAHEFGHFYGGDTKLGPWVYKTRAAIERTLAGLRGRSTIVQMPFVWYGNMFLRATLAVSRRQEFSADALAARTVGSQAMIEGLRAVHGGAGAYDAYWHNELAPVLNAGYRPPLADGFRTFVASPAVRAGIARFVDCEIAEGRSNPYDSHLMSETSLRWKGRLGSRKR